MTNQEIQALIEAGLPGATVILNGDGHHFEATIVAPQFVDQSSVARQQLVYASLGDAITSGEVHAFSMKTFAPGEEA